MLSILNLQDIEHHTIFCKEPGEPNLKAIQLLQLKPHGHFFQMILQATETATGQTRELRNSRGAMVIKVEHERDHLLGEAPPELVHGHIKVR